MWFSNVRATGDINQCKQTQDQEFHEKLSINPSLNRLRDLTTLNKVITPAAIRACFHLSYRTMDCSSLSGAPFQSNVS
jgi:hypothetical protein